MGREVRPSWWLRALVTFCASFATTAGPAQGCAANPASRPGETRTAGAAVGGAAAGAGTVSGTVIDDRGKVLLAGRSIAIGSVHTMTDDDGRFSVPDAPATYDLVIIDPDGTTVTLYEGLRRRDLLLRHHKSPSDFAQPSLSATPSNSVSPQVVTRTVHVTGTVDHAPTSPPSQRLVYYVVPPWPGVRIPLADDAPRPNAVRSFDFIVQLPEVPGGSLCFTAFSSMGDNRLPIVLDSICGIVPGTLVAAVLQAPPRFTSPAPDATVRPTTPLAWTAFDHGVYRLELSSGHSPSAAAPILHVYTAARSMTWPDLSSFDVPFPADAEYGFSIVGLGVFASLDDLTGPTGFASAVTPEFRQSYLNPVKVHVLR